ncbi:MAG: hypothetical protein CVU08_12155 [Bacteroidetes bacterium HGW-Bacteroidetes-3]|nr:MAG: hypothetical protein CVU08_12155 [Bacteroidetes bacterium HGW-Bacteroidetes-3]
MKKNHILIIGLLLITISCGKNKKEIENEKAQIEIQQKVIAEKKEQERIHLEKIEVGKSILKTHFSNELERLKKVLQEQERKLTEIYEFQFGRANSTKEKQLNEQNIRIGQIQSYISRIEKEISLTNLRETFDFQDSPKGVINYLFESAKNNDFEKLRHLCDPYGENDGDSRGICFVAMQPSEMQNQFVESFKKGRIMSEPKIENDRAEVEIAYGPNSDKLEKINLVKRMDKWYIVSI